MRLNSGIEAVNSRVVISGSIIEYYQYEHAVFKGVKSNSIGRSGTARDENKVKNREDVLRRARQAIRRTVNSNVWAYGDCSPKFLTLTFADNITDIKTANYEFTKFIQRLNYSVFGVKTSCLKYTVVIEFQQRGAIHYHVIFYNLPYISADKLAEIWANGFIKVNRIDDVDNVGAYVCKYLTKANDDTRLQGRKCYFSSRGLKKPEEITDDKKIDDLISHLPRDKITYSAEFDNEHIGSVKYTQYSL